jgi:hypothetical protein
MHVRYDGDALDPFRPITRKINGVTQFGPQKKIQLKISTPDGVTVS